jgi:hypothetical protein
MRVVLRFRIGLDRRFEEDAVTPAWDTSFAARVVYSFIIFGLRRPVAGEG